MICDSCHSGTILDLNYIHTPPRHVNGPRANRWEQINSFDIAGEVYLISGCMDNQCSVTTSKMSQGQATTGAMLYSLVQAIESNRAYTYGELLFTMRQIIESSLGKGKITYNNNVSDNTNYYGASYHGASRRPENRGMSNALGAQIAAGIGVGIASAMAASTAYAVTGNSAFAARTGGRVLGSFMGGKTQIPQLSASHMINLQTPFSL